MANVILRDVHKTYPGGVEAIKGINFEVGDGKFCVLVGPSGCGKSTLLRMVAGLETITGGDIAMVFQNYALYPHMSVYNNMAYGLRNRGMPKPEIDTRVQEAARILEIGPMLDRKPRQLSGGPSHRAAAESISVRRTLVEPRRQAAHRDARRNPEITKAIKDHVDLRDPRPAGGDDASRYFGGDEWRPGGADRQPARHLSEARNDLRCLIYRRAADESDSAAIGRNQIAIRQRQPHHK